MASRVDNRRSFREAVAVEEATTPSGYQVVSVVRRDLIVVEIRGTLRKGADTDRVTTFLRQSVLASVHGAVFFDLEEFAQYDSEVRARYTEAIRAGLRQLDAVWVLAESKLVRMGATVAGLVIPQLRLVDKREFERLLEQALAPSADQNR